MFRKLRRLLGLSNKTKRLHKDRAAPTRVHSASRRALRSGAVHPTLGRNLFGEPFGKSGRDVFEGLLDLGLQPGDVVIDYGCGTLRIGFHLISYLEPGKYWGLDLDPTLLDAGRSQIGEELDREKAPNLHVINDAALDIAVAAGPRFLLSHAVLLHVRSEDMGVYLANIGRAVERGATALVTLPSEMHRKDSPKRSSPERDEKRAQRRRRNEAAVRGWAEENGYVSSETALNGDRVLVIENR